MEEGFRVPGNDEICRMEAVELRDRIRRKDLSPVEVVDAVLDRMEKLEPTLHAFSTPTPDRAREEARRVEAEISAGNEVGPLAGVPVGIKDLVARGHPYSHGLALLQGLRPPRRRRRGRTPQRSRGYSAGQDQRPGVRL